MANGREIICNDCDEEQVSHVRGIPSAPFAGHEEGGSCLLCWKSKIPWTVCAVCGWDMSWVNGMVAHHLTSDDGPGGVWKLTSSGRLSGATVLGAGPNFFCRPSVLVGVLLGGICART